VRRAASIVLHAMQAFAPRDAAPCDAAPSAAAHSMCLRAPTRVVRSTVCKSVIGAIDADLTMAERGDLETIEKKMRKWCDSAKGKDKTMCYYMGVGDAESGTAGGVKREISSSLGRGINAKRLCTRLKKKDGQMCELK
jgi:hypothetical protein